MRLVFLGPPGVGKGTQAERLSKQYRVPHIATGDILRAAMANKTPVGLEAKSYIDAGKLVPDDVIINIIRERLKEHDTKEGYILDGFPRTIKQGEALSKTLEQSGEKIDRALYFELPEEELVKRIAGRRSCPACKKVYHTAFNPPPQEGVCTCGTALVQRKDDRPETVKERLAVYRNETAPLIQYYKERGLLSQIDADQSVEAVAKRVQDAIFQKKSS
ncbi:MAG: adenylate kinase [Candidatus Manganitrophaceae bacterium]|nr:MAG: adenylate kinase [Candidatus Manganitrophaceae bacterium]